MTLTSDPREPLEPVELSLLLRPMYTRSAFGAEQNIFIITQGYNGKDNDRKIYVQ